MEYRELAEESGMENFYRAALNTHPVFIEALADLVIESIESPNVKFSDVIRPSKKVKMYPQEQWEWGLTTGRKFGTVVWR